MAAFAILSWPVLALLLFRNLPVISALIWVVLLPYLYLPEAFQIGLPGLPDLDKTGVISIGLMLCLLLYRPKIAKELGAPPKNNTSGLLKFLLGFCFLLLFVGLFLTVQNNREPLVYGPLFIPAARPWDALSNVVQWTLILLPFFIAIRYLSSAKAHRIVLQAFVFAGLAYSVLMLIEIRLSPQLHTWVYGYFQHMFLQHIRGGFRPIVFLQHGLWVGFFIFMSVMAAAALWKITKDRKWLWAGLWLFVILFLSKNMGAFGIAIMMLGVFFVLGRSLQRWFVLVIALIVLFFPALRQFQLVPTDNIVAVAAAISEARADSLEFRLRNEDALLDRAWEKKWTGWGSWGRDRVYNDFGQYETVSEGRWIQTLGQRGWIGYLSLFGLLTLPLVGLARRRRTRTIPPETLALALIAAGNLIYMIPNSTMTPIGLMVFGAVAGFALYGRYDEAEDAEIQTGGQKDTRRAPRYTRFGTRGNGPSVGAVPPA